MWGHKAMITGVVRDFNASSLHEKITPTIILCGADSYFKGGVRLNTENMSETLDKVRAVWENMYTTHIYEFKFLDDTISGLYESERRVTKLVGLFAGVAIFIGCIGLFGLISFMTRSRTKEVVAFTCTVVLATVGLRSYRAAVANPVDALCDE